MTEKIDGPVTLALIEEIERRDGGIYAAARRLVESGRGGAEMLPSALRLAEMIAPLENMGAVVVMPDGGKRPDLRSLRRFFMGVLGWTPKTVMHEATLCDLEDAFLGYAHRNGLLKSGVFPDKGFLIDMMKRFPDKDKNV